jgi:4,5-dihydroxyphthalate decarboxylase
VAKSLFDAFSQAKDEWLQRLNAGEANTASDQKYAQLRKIVGADPLPYGMAANWKTLEALSSTAFRQGLTPRKMPVADLFVDPEKT